MAILMKGVEKGAHWYTRDGVPMHRVMKADGSGDRATTLKDARRLGLLPSVTGVIGVLARPSLESWKMKQVAQAAMRMPKAETESEEYWVRRVIEGAFEQVEDAADVGSSVHAALEAGVAGDAYDEARWGVYVRPVLDGIAGRGLAVTAREKTLVNASHGFAGTADLFFTWRDGAPGILDYKTKRTRPGEKVEAYDEHRLQLAAYAATEYGDAYIGRVRAVNVFVSSTEPGRVEWVHHGDLTPDWGAFRLLCGLWRHLKGYDPRCAGN